MHIFQYICNMSAKCRKGPMKARRGVDLQSMYYQLQYKHPIVRITKRHNSCNTDPSAPIFLSNVHCVMVKVWCKFEQIQTKAIKVIEQKPYLLSE